MIRQALTCLSVATVTALIFVYPLSIGLGGPQDQPKGQLPGAESAKPKLPIPGLDQPPAPPGARRRAASEARERAIGAMIEEFDLKPPPPQTIPDDPPPHERAMIGLTQTLEPSDLVIVEVLDAIPGRPISGERLVRPDGTVQFGFYGEVYVKGLTPKQAKVAVIKHLRKYLTDEALGLEVSDSPEPDPAEIQRPAVPFPEDKPSVFPPDDGATIKKKRDPPRIDHSLRLGADRCDGPRQFVMEIPI